MSRNSTSKRQLSGQEQVLQGNEGVHETLMPIQDALKVLYKQKMLPLEQLYKFDAFNSPFLTTADFKAKPMVLLVGQYSVGKTSFIKFLLEKDFPNLRIGPEPTTDRFAAVMYGRDERVIPGNALAADADKPFTALSKFGMAFLNRFEAATCPSPILKKITFVDTPGVLSGEKQRLGRQYEFPDVVAWFAERADRILLLFDAHKLDISDEFKRTIECLRPHDEKTRVVLNKADMPVQKLLRVYGALMWSLGKVYNTPEVLRVYIGSFWDQELQFKENEALIQAEMQDLLADLRSLPRNSAVRRINELVKRARMLKVHVHLLSHLRDQFGWFSKEKTQEKLLKGMLQEYKTVQKANNLPMGDFPHLKDFKAAISAHRIDKFPKVNKKQLAALDEIISKDIPLLMKQLPSEQAKENKAQMGARADLYNPFADNLDKASVGATWAVDKTKKASYDNKFYQLTLSEDGVPKVSGANARGCLLASGLDSGMLRKIWDLSDIDRDGHLDADEFSVAMYLIDCINEPSEEEFELPAELPLNLIPPSKRDLFEED